MSTGYITTLTPQTQRGESLSGLLTTVAGYGTPVRRATTHDDVVKNVYIRMNYNAWVKAGSPTIKPEYYSSSLIGGIIHRYRSLVVSRYIPYYKDGVFTDADVDAVRTACCSVTPSREVARAVLQNLYWAAFGTGANVDATFVYPPINGQPSAEAEAKVREMNAKADAEKASQDDCGFLCQVTTPLKSLGNFTTIMSYAIPAVLLTVAGGVVFLMVSKGRQFDVNKAYSEQHRTIREIGPETAAAIVRKGM